MAGRAACARPAPRQHAKSAPPPPPCGGSGTPAACVAAARAPRAHGATAAAMMVAQPPPAAAAAHSGAPLRPLCALWARRTHGRDVADTHAARAGARSALRGSSRSAQVAGRVASRRAPQPHAALRSPAPRRGHAVTPRRAPPPLHSLGDGETASSGSGASDSVVLGAPLAAYAARPVYVLTEPITLDKLTALMARARRLRAPLRRGRRADSACTAVCRCWASPGRA